MKPDRTNYEIWIIDYLDGKLDHDQVSLLLNFLDQNPDLKNEFGEFRNTVLSSDLEYHGKNSLKKTVNEIPASQFELLCFASAEGDLSPEQRTELEEIIYADPEKKKELELFKQIRLIAPVSIYAHKASLKHLTLQQKVLRLSLASISVAAGIAILMLFVNTAGVKTDNRVENLSLNSSKVKVETPVPVIKEQQVVNPETTINKTIQKINAKQTYVPVATAELRDTMNRAIIKEQTGSRQDLNPVVIPRAEFHNDADIPVQDISSSLTLVDIPQKQITVTYEKPGISEYFALFVREKILKSKIPETGNLKGYEVAETGIIGLNRLLGWDMSLKQNRNEKGELRSLYFSSKIIKFNTPVKKALVSL